MDISDTGWEGQGRCHSELAKFMPQSQSLIQSAAFFLSSETSLPFHPLGNRVSLNNVLGSKPTGDLCLREHSPGEQNSIKVYTAGKQPSKPNLKSVF